MLNLDGKGDIFFLIGSGLILFRNFTRFTLELACLCIVTRSLVSYPVCSRGTEWLKWDYFIIYVPALKFQKSLIYVILQQLFFLLSTAGPSLEIFALGMPLHAYVFSFAQIAVVLPELRCVHSKSRTRIFSLWYFYEWKQTPLT